VALFEATAAKRQGESKPPGLYSKQEMTEKELAKISKALSDPTRLRLYEQISARKEMFCGELMQCCPLTPGTVSHHLKILAEANLIESRREGQFIYNRALPKTIREYTLALRKMTMKSKDRIFDLGNSGGSDVAKEKDFMIAVAHRRKRR
jgi:ArsR family transcriptional regulator